MTRIFFAFLFSLSMLSPAQADIFGGEDVRASDGVQNSIVALYQQTSNTQGALCTASLLGQDVALTAAHCVSGSSMRTVLIFGRTLQSRQQSPNVRQVSRVLISPRWSRSEGQGMDEGDIALVRFEGGLPSGYHAAEPLSSDAALKAGQKLILAGYGISNAVTHTGAGVLRKTEVTLIDPRPGKTEMILDQTHGKGACHGDSGGPAFLKLGARLILAGVTNRGYPATAPDNCASDVVYTKVSAYYSWIEKGIQELRSSH